MTEKPLISVIIPAHNNEQTIATAIESMVKQTYTNLEIIVIDDNSTDDTKKVVRKLIERYENLFFYPLPFDDPNRFNKRGRNINAGYAARNYGFEKVHGEWITFQDADDASLLNRIEVQYGLVTRYDAIHVCVDWQKFNPALLGKTLDADRILREHPDAIIWPQDITALAKKTKGVLIPFLGPINALIPFEWKRFMVINKFFFRALDPYPGTGNSPLFKREVIEKVRFRKLSDRVWPSFMGRGADRDFNFQVAETYKNSIVVLLPLYMWRVNIQNQFWVDIFRYLV
ncbi:MAG: glycosyltransferase family 2 protein [Patescibacteria group bacterium]|mgnify:FL=1